MSVRVAKSVEKKRAAPKDSDSDIEIVSQTPGKKAKTGSGRHEGSSLLTTLDEPHNIKSDKRIRKPTEKVKAADAGIKSPAKRAVTIPIKKVSQVALGDDAVVDKKTSKVQRVESASKASVSVPVEGPERGLLASCVLVPFSSNAKVSEDETMMDLKTLLGILLSKNDHCLLSAALKFMSYSLFINPSLASPDLVVVEKDHLVWADSKMNAVFFTTGHVSTCNLIIPVPGINNSAAAKKLLLFSIEGVFQEALNFFGFKFKVTQAAGQISNGMVTYSTKKEGHTLYASSSGIVGSPKKKGLFKKPLSQATASSVGNFPVALSFNENVPIYDATGGSFVFKESDLTDIRSLPLYRKGSHNLPPYAVVTIAYTVTSFVTSNSASANMALLFNVLFAVLLAEKINEEEEDDA